MKLVTFTRDMLPIRAGETRLYPDEVIGKLVENGLIAADPPDWPEKPKIVSNTAPPPRADRAARRYSTK
ncbi:MAG: hypothetical protein ACREC9_15070 [Methylocella sp.]